MDKRQEKTRKAIFEALSALLTEKSYCHISVQEIAGRANIGRSTFYAHFETKDDLLKELSVDLFDHVFLNSLLTESTHDFSGNRSGFYVVTTHILYHIKENQKKFAGVLTSESGELFFQFFKQYLNDLYTVKFIKGIENEDFPIPYKFLSDHISGSFINMIQWWIKGGMKQSPEELTEYFRAVTEPVVKLAETMPNEAKGRLIQTL